MGFTAEDVIRALREVIHPENEKDIISLGLVKDVQVEGKKVSFTLELKKSNDPFANSLKKASVMAVKSKVDNSAEIEGNITIKAEKEVHQETPLGGVKNIPAIASGKGGVGKSTVAVNLAVALAQKGYSVGLIDADVYGPSIPKMFAVEDDRPELKKMDGKDRIIPLEKYGVKLLSIGFFVNQDDALVWRGPMATSALKQLINDGYWGDLDYLLIDLPPGTGDIHLTLVQTLSVTGAVIVSTPQAVALADAIKGISMFTGDHVKVPVLGLIENMAWFTPAELPDSRYYIFGKEGCKNLAEKSNLPLLGQIPIVQSIRESGDNGEPVALNKESIVGQAFSALADRVEDQVEKRNANLAPTEIVKIKTQ